MDPDDPRSVDLLPTGATHRPAVKLPSQQGRYTRPSLLARRLPDRRRHRWRCDGHLPGTRRAAGSASSWPARDGPRARVARNQQEHADGALYSVGLDSQLVFVEHRLAAPHGAPSPVPPWLHRTAARPSATTCWASRPTRAWETSPPSAATWSTSTPATARPRPLGLTSQDYVNQFVASTDGSRALMSVETVIGRQPHRGVGPATPRARLRDLALPRPVRPGFAVGLNAAISPDGRTAYSSLGATRIGVFDLPSGRYRGSFTVTFAGPDAARVYAIPWMFDPRGRLLFGGYDAGPLHGAAAASPGRVDYDATRPATRPRRRQDTRPSSRRPTSGTSSSPLLWRGRTTTGTLRSARTPARSCATTPTLLRETH